MCYILETGTVLIWKTDHSSSLFSKSYRGYSLKPTVLSLAWHIVHDINRGMKGGGGCSGRLHAWISSGSHLPLTAPQLPTTHVLSLTRTPWHTQAAWHEHGDSVTAAPGHGHIYCTQERFQNGIQPQPKLAFPAWRSRYVTPAVSAVRLILHQRRPAPHSAVRPPSWQGATALGLQLLSPHFTAAFVQFTAVSTSWIFQRWWWWKGVFPIYDMATLG